MKIDWPYLDAWFDCGLFQIQTAIWRTAWHTDSRDYVILEFRVLRKWGLRFRLYETAMRIFERRPKLKMEDAEHGELPRVSTLSSPAAGDQEESK